MKTLVLADEANVVASLRTLNRRADWLKLREFLASPREERALTEFVLYIGLPPNIDAGGFKAKRQKKDDFVQWAAHHGFLVVSKEGSPTGEDQYKANVDVLMAIDAVDLAMAMKPDLVVLMTGDADFAHLALTLRRRGIRVEVASLPASLGAGLKSAVNGVIDLAAIAKDLPLLRETAAGAGGSDLEG